MPYVGLSITYCANKEVTDSGAGGTALAIGQKALYGSIGLDSLSNPHLSLLKIAKNQGKSTAIITSCDVTHATPASFVANVKDRNQQDEIALSFIKENIDIVIGGGKDRFVASKRKDKLNLIDSLTKKKYEIYSDLEQIKNTKSDRFYALLGEGHLDNAKKRGNVLPESLEKTLNTLSKNENGFFIMLEGSKIDMEAHLHKYNDMIDEVKDFDKCVEIALEFAKKNGETLIVVTADHETGGLTLPADNNLTKDEWTSWHHTAVPVPIFSFGVGAENFTGVMQNTDVFWKIYSLIKK
jgi:alkaline phosphatase